MTDASLRSLTAAACAGGALALAACSGAPLETDAMGASETPRQTIAYVDIDQSRSVDVEPPRPLDVEPAASVEFDAEAGAAVTTDDPPKPEASAVELLEPGAEAGLEPLPQESYLAGHAIAHFVEAPSAHTAVLELVGLAPAVPSTGQCERRAKLSKTPFSAMRELRLLDAGEVNIRAEASNDGHDDLFVSLAPRAFPSVSSFASGVMYTSRDRSARLLEATRYTIEVSGGARVPALTFAAQAPYELNNVTLGGVPVDQVDQLSTAAPIDLTWDVGASGDIVYIELENTGSEPSIRCAFADDAGAASVPVDELFGLSGPGRLSIHRLRVVRHDFAASEPHEALRRAEVRFNFEVTRSVDFVE